MVDSVKSHARVVVIGGGIAGCSTLYHLTQLGWTDVALVERDELTSGSTWHAAAQVTQFGGNQTMIGLKRHSIDLYRELAKDTEHPFYYEITGGMRTAYTQDHIDTYQHYIGMAKSMGVEMEYISPKEIKERHPLLSTDKMLGAWWDPLDGYIDPSGITLALARKAREAGASVYRSNPVESITKKENGEFIVHTKNGDITCEKVVNATGYRVNEVGNMLGVEHPVTSMEHMYFLTDNLPELEALDFQVPIIRDPLDDFYSRQEKNGLLVGIYEQDCKTFGMDGIDPNFTRDLCPPDLDRCLDNMERIFERMPALQEAGIHTTVNGPITYTIDGAPLIGQIPGIENAYCAIGLRAGIGEGGGHGKILADLIVHGECEWDAWCVDPRRFTQYANTEHTTLKTIEDYQNEFHYHMPHEHRPASRLARTTPIYPVLDQKDAAWGVVNGWERTLFFKPTPDFVDEHSFRFTPTKDVVDKEIKAMTKNVGIMEVSGFNRFSIQGEGAADFLDGLTCSNIPKKVGKVSLCYLLNEHGHVLTEATLAKLDEDHFWYGSAAAAEWHDLDWLNKHKPDTVTITEMAASHTILVVAGPKSRELLQSLSPRCDWSKAAFPWLNAKEMTIGHAKVMAMTISFSGELAYELHVPNEQLYLAYKLINEAGEKFGLTQFGMYATESMRMEKGYLHWKADLIYERNPMESGIGFFVKMDKPSFIGKEPLAKMIAEGNKKQLATFVFECDIAPAHVGDSMYNGDKLVGTVTSGAYGHRVNKNIAYAFVEPEFAVVGTELKIEILGEMYPAVVTETCLYDPKNELVRG
ncbi:FAD-dependent oxidoreductase [Leucothrix arctica]|uniref:FAD-dependent oxidoreductase n=1 Tax=Leucothrix arctica TaxID=1481894 RepID=A0A317CJT8_9GAMM|nr:FAD-dependent oxidoreductase [Leucothrix arctica]PWQ98477.1 FAD-dependent oxidoreductase [Leucothrix arctica]